jgi:hypothetical protein
MSCALPSAVSMAAPTLQMSLITCRHTYNNSSSSSRREEAAAHSRLRTYQGRSTLTQTAPHPAYSSAQLPRFVCGTACCRSYVNISTHCTHPAQCTAGHDLPNSQASVTPNPSHMRAHRSPPCPPHLAPELWVACDGVIIVVHPHQLCLIHGDGLVQPCTRIALKVLAIAVRPGASKGGDNSRRAYTSRQGDCTAGTHSLHVDCNIGLVVLRSMHACASVCLPPSCPWPHQHIGTAPRPSCYPLSSPLTTQWPAASMPVNTCTTSNGHPPRT